MTARAWRASAVAAFLAAGCASFPVTERLDKYDSHKGYRYERLKANGNDDELFVVLTFSGGGTRAAAFSYGVLEERSKNVFQSEFRTSGSTSKSCASRVPARNCSPPHSQGTRPPASSASRCRTSLAANSVSAQ